MATTDTNPIARCSTAAMNQAEQDAKYDRSLRVGSEEVGQDRVKPGRPDDGAQGPSDAGDEQDFAAGVEALAHRRPCTLRAESAPAKNVCTEQADEEREVGVADEGDEIIGESEPAKAPKAIITRGTRIGSRQTNNGGVVVSFSASSVVSCTTIASSTSSSFGRIPVSAAQEQAEDQRRRDRRQRPEHEAVDQPGAEWDVPEGPRSRPLPVPESRRRSRRRSRSRGRRTCAANRSGR